MDPALRALAARLPHAFSQPELLETALNHRSAAFEAGAARRGKAPADNERLEFLGDAVLAFVASEVLFTRFPEASEGELTRLRAALVNEQSLASIAARLDLGSALRLGKGEDRSGGRAKPSLLADALEAVFAAIFLDAGVATARTVIAGLIAPTLDELARSRSPGHDAKTLFQERFQAQYHCTPTYALLGHRGPDHQRVWEVEMYAGDHLRTRGEGRSKKAAEQAAATEGLALLDAGWKPPTTSATPPAPSTPPAPTAPATPTAPSEG